MELKDLDKDELEAAIKQMKKLLNASEYRDTVKEEICTNFLFYVGGYTLALTLLKEDETGKKLNANTSVMEHLMTVARLVVEDWSKKQEEVKKQEEQENA